MNGMSKSIPDGEPYDMSQFTLGERYGAEDVYRDMGISPGSRITVEKDGVLYTDTVQSMAYQSAHPAIWRDLKVWQRLVRRLTPARFRKPLKPVRGGKPASVSIQVGSSPNPLERHQKTLQEMQEAIGKITK